MGKEKFREYNGCNYLRQRLVLSLLSAKPVKINNIRYKSDDPGIRDFESSLLRLIDKITNGSKIEVSDTGTRLMLRPGLLMGGRIEHDCGTEHSIGYFLELLVAVAPFCKDPINAVLTGVTNNQIDPSVDLIKHSCFPVLRKFFLDDEGLELKVQKRGAAPLGGGQVVFRCPVKRQLRPCQVLDQGKIKRIRGVAWAVRVSPNVVNRVVEAAKGKLLKYLPDVYIYTDHFTGAKSGKSPGFGIILTAETNEGVMLCAEVCSNPAGSKQVSVPEDLGKEAATKLLEEIYRGGCADSCSQSLAALLMCLGPADVSKFLVGPLSPYTIQYLKHIKDFLDLMFKLETRKKAKDEEELSLGADKVLMTCVGVGYSNISKRTT
jgi:RNA 3'-terminal phosphate cyclase-like protein